MVKGDSQISQHTRIAFCTYGVMLRRLQQDPTLQAVSTVVLDEVHERGIDSDFTLALLMFALAKRPDLKIILMVRVQQSFNYAPLPSRDLYACIPQLM
jgi:HrpA-like RNA helicase